MIRFRVYDEKGPASEWPLVNAHLLGREDLVVRGKVAFRDGEIVAVGRDAEVSRFVDDGTRVVDLTGRLALPGFHDAHIHPLSSGHAMLGC